MKRRHATGLLLPTNAPELQIPLYKRAFNEYQPLHIPTDSDLHIDKPLGQGGNRADEKPSMVSSLPKEVFPLYLSRGLAGASAIRREWASSDTVKPPKPVERKAKGSFDPSVA